MLLVLCETALLGYLHENVTTIKLPNLDQTALYFVMALVSRDVAGVFGSTRAGESSEEGKEENTEKVIIMLIPAEYMENFEIRKYSTFTILRHQGNHCSHHLWCINLWNSDQ